MDLLCIFVITKLHNTFFSVLVIIVTTWIIFVIIIRIFFHSYHELFFSGTLNYFSNVYRSRNIFSLGGELFFAVSRIYLLAYNALRALQLKGTGSSVSFPWRAFWKLCKRRSAFKENAKAKHCQGKKRKSFPSFLSKSERSQWSVRKWWGFLDWRLNRGDYEATSRLIHTKMSTQINSSLPNLVPRVPYYTRWHGFRNEGAEYESVPYSNIRKKLPILIQTGGHNK